MRYLAIMCLLFFVISIASAEPQVSRNMQDSAEVGEILTVVLTINPDSESRIDIAEFIPLDWEIVDWVVSPKLNVNYESNTQEFLGAKRNMNHWGFESVSDEIIIEYTIIAKEVGQHDFVMLWVYPNGFDSSSETMVVSEKQENAVPSGITGYFVQPVESPELLQKNIEFSQAKAVLNNVKNIIFGIPF